MAQINCMLGDCLENMKSLHSNSIDLVLTSPPYNCGKAYGENNDAITKHDYWKFTQEWVRESYRLLRYGGRLAVNLPWWMGKKPRVDVPYYFKKITLSEGFLFLDKIIWVKGTTQNITPTGASGWGTYLSPSGPAIRCVSEPILIFSKGSRGRGVVSGEGRGACKHGDCTKEEWLDWTKDIWLIPGESSKIHPAVFPVEVPKRLIKLYTYEGENVLDPFAGIGTTGVACKMLNRNAILIEKEQIFFQFLNQRINADEEEE